MVARRQAGRGAESGQGMLEYILIVVFIAVAGIALWRNFGEQVRALVQESSESLDEEALDLIRDGDE